MTGGAGFGVICKAPRAGSSKTRLLEVFEPGDAAALSAAFIRDVADLVEEAVGRTGGRGYAIYAPPDAGAELASLVPGTFGLLPQADRDLGVVLRGAARLLIERGHDAAILINSDSPTLPVAFLVEAVDRLKAAGDRAVLGPAMDGGYYLIGVKDDHPALFQNIPWSTSSVTARTLAQAASIGLSVEILPGWYDVDDPASYAVLLDDLAGRRPELANVAVARGQAQATRAFLKRHPSVTRSGPAD
jgi:rSAM/selenodomain-associated transferase 1